MPDRIRIALLTGALAVVGGLVAVQLRPWAGDVPEMTAAEAVDRIAAAWNAYPNLAPYDRFEAEVEGCTLAWVRRRDRCTRPNGAFASFQVVDMRTTSVHPRLYPDGDRAVLIDEAVSGFTIGQSHRPNTRTYGPGETWEDAAVFTVSDLVALMDGRPGDVWMHCDGSVAYGTHPNSHRTSLAGEPADAFEDAYRALRRAQGCGAGER